MNFNLIIISGFSGSGKGTVLNKLLSRHPELELIKSYTTRYKRDDFDFYSFVAVPEFLQLMKQGYFLEFNNYSGEWYGTPIKPIKDCIDSGKVAVIEVDTNGFIQIIRSSLAKEFNILSVYIVADANTIVRRLVNRNTENIEKIINRISTSLIECDKIELYDLILHNNDLNLSTTLLERAIFNGEYPLSDFNIEAYKTEMHDIIKQFNRSLL